VSVFISEEKEVAKFWYLSTYLYRQINSGLSAYLKFRRVYHLIKYAFAGKK
jgi:hypothetical protein